VPVSSSVSPDTRTSQLQFEPEAVQVVPASLNTPFTTVVKSSHVTVTLPVERQLIGTVMVSEADSDAENAYVIFESNVTVPLALNELTEMVSLAHTLFAAGADETSAHDPMIFQVPTRSPPQGATFPQSPPLALELLHPRNAAPIANHARQAFM
jgi:hypothetical protein